MTEKEKKKAQKAGEEYIAPRRTHIKDAVCELLPQVPAKLVRALDYWALYSIHQDVVKSGMDTETAARKYVKGYDPDKIREAQEREAARKEREREARRKKAEAQKKKIQARARAATAKVKARAARAAARAKAQAAKAKARSAQQDARAKSAAEKAEAGTADRPGGPPAEAYIPPVRKHIKDELVKLIPNIKRSDITGLDWWEIYSMHTELVKFGYDAGQVARKFIKGYKPVKVTAPPPPKPAAAVAPAPRIEEPVVKPVAEKVKPRKRAKVARKKKAKRKVSAATRKKMSEAQKKRWAKKKAGKTKGKAKKKTTRKRGKKAKKK